MAGSLFYCLLQRTAFHPAFGLLMDILFVVPYIPNLIRVRPFNLIKRLTVRGHRVTVLTLWTSPQEREDIEILKTICHEVRALPLPPWRSWWNCGWRIGGSEPLQALYCWRPDLAAQIIEVASKVDVIHIEHLRGVRYGLYLKSQWATVAHRPPIVWDSVDCISLLFRQAAGQSQRSVSRWMTRFELGRTQRYEGWLTSQFERVLVTSPADREALSALAPETAPEPAITVLPNGVDLDYFTPGDQAKREPATLVMSGKMSYHANVTMLLTFVRDIFPLVCERRPDVRLLVVGKDPPREVMALAQSPRITITGTVRDVRPYLQGAAISVAPVAYGAGIQNKVLEAMACATPVVSTPQAVSALKVAPGREVVVAQEAETFAEAVLGLLEDPRRQREIGAAGRRYVETHHPWSAVAKQLEEVYHEVACNRR
jgi:sugar transferase (PEP-CTERM/EpsH1 system associated)